MAAILRSGARRLPEQAIEAEMDDPSIVKIGQRRGTAGFGMAGAAVGGLAGTLRLPEACMASGASRARSGIRNSRRQAGFGVKE